MEAKISAVSNCRNSKIQINATSESLKRHEVNCVISDKNGRNTIEITYKSKSFNKFVDVSTFAEHIVKAGEGKRFWLKVAEAYQKEYKTLNDTHYCNFDFFKFQAEELDDTKEETFGSYFKRNSSRFYDSTRTSFTQAAILQRVIDILGAVCK